jgi:hypothetical protein
VGRQRPDNTKFTDHIGFTGLRVRFAPNGKRPGRGVFKTGELLITSGRKIKYFCPSGVIVGVNEGVAVWVDVLLGVSVGVEVGVSVLGRVKVNVSDGVNVAVGE